MVRTIQYICLTLIIQFFSYSFFAQDKHFEKYFYELESEDVIKTGVKLIKVNNQRLISFDINNLGKHIKNATYKNNALKENEIRIQLPHPDGKNHTYKIYRNTTLHPELLKKFPEIMTFDAINVSDPSEWAKIDLTPQGFHAMIMKPGSSTIFIDPYISGNTEHYTCYYKKDFRTEKKMSCNINSSIKHLRTKLQGHNKSFGTCELRTYRLALAATGEYTTFHGGSIALAQAAQATTMNRVNGIYERDMAITMVIIANNDLLIYINSSSDPYTNGTPSTMIVENQINVTSVIGSSNYDIGHVFGTNSGGLAGLGVVCSNSSKASGVTGSAAPIGDPFDVDYVSHEMGHQFGASHTFNNSCGGNISTATAMEPGSGNTIMAYAGICSPNTQNFSDDHFHGVSLEDIENEILSGSHTCPVITPIANSAPVISSTNGNITIPANTPFALTANATDPDGDTLTYNWEQMNNDVTTQPPVSSSTSGPNFKSNPSLTNPTRYFPNLVDLANGGPFTWEVIPSVARIMDFRVIVRDNSIGSGCNDHADVTVTIDAASGPFILTYPDATGITWSASTTETVTWNVSNTDNAPVNCTNVDLFLSTDGGGSYPTVLATNVSNDGNEDIVVPNVSTTTARVMVISANGTFFDISDNDFTISGSSCNDPDIPVVSGLDTTCSGDTVTLSIASGNLNDATNWQWYEVSCGGTSIGTGTAINVIPVNLTNSYFVRGEGGCVTPGACAQFDIITQSNYNTSDTSCGSYNWNGQTYFFSGIYTDSLITSTGCDSVVSLYLTIIDSYSDTSFVSSCSTYNWNGQTYSSSGFYTDSLISTFGCDSIISLDLLITDSSASPFEFTLILDDWCLETSWKLVNSSNYVLTSGGPYTCNPNGGGTNANDTIEKTFVLNGFDCYSLIIYDLYADGLNGSFWGGTDGSWLLKDSNNTSLFSGSGSFGDSVYIDFMVTSYDTTSIIIENTLNNTPFISVYPNPFSESALVTIHNVPPPFTIEIFDIMGRVVERWDRIIQSSFVITNNKFTSGVYFIVINADLKIKPFKFIIE